MWMNSRLHPFITWWAGNKLLLFLMVSMVFVFLTFFCSGFSLGPDAVEELAFFKFIYFNTFFARIGSCSCHHTDGGWLVSQVLFTLQIGLIAIVLLMILHLQAPEPSWASWQSFLCLQHLSCSRRWIEEIQSTNFWTWNPRSLRPGVCPSHVTLKFRFSVIVKSI